MKERLAFPQWEKRLKPEERAATRPGETEGSRVEERSREESRRELQGRPQDSLAKGDRAESETHSNNGIRASHNVQFLERFALRWSFASRRSRTYVSSACSRHC